MLRIWNSKAAIQVALQTVVAVAVLGAASVTHAQLAEKWTKPTPEELSMTSQPEVPGAAAVILFREQATDDIMHTQSLYVRLKVLTDAGKKYGDVRLSFDSESEGDPFMLDFTKTLIRVEGRTIHSDGTVIPFSGKPFTRNKVKENGMQFTEKAFAMPDVEVGSILEYRYEFAIPQEYFQSPQWNVQQDLFVRQEHFYWKATEEQLHDSERDADTLGISYSSALPAGVKVVHTEKPETLTDGATQVFDLVVKNLPPLPREEYMPPMRSMTYRVYFYYALDRTQDEFWKNEGKIWQKRAEGFVAPRMTSQAQSLIVPGDSDDVKLKKLYAAVMAMDNTSFTREHELAEDKANGLKEVKTVADIWNRKSGSSNELTGLFVALARGAGYKAYMMQVTNRDYNIFWPAWLTLQQLDDYVAIVAVGGKDLFFDPGQKYCPYGQMNWMHTGVGGLRETEGGTALAVTPEPPYLESQTQRIADLTLDPDGAAHGMLKITWTGAPALNWREKFAHSDEEAVKLEIKHWMEMHLPDGMDTTVTSLDNLESFEKPLTANFSVHGPLGMATDKRMMLPGQLFEADSKPLFPEPKRDISVYFEHGGRVIDAVRVKYPDGMRLESAPTEDQFKLQNLASYHDKPEATPGFILMRRTYDLATSFFIASEYPDVKVFYDKMATHDQQPIVLLRSNVGTDTVGHDAAK